MKVRVRFHGSKTSFVVKIPKGVTLPKDNSVIIVQGEEPTTSNLDKFVLLFKRVTRAF